MPNMKFEFASVRELWEFALSFEEGSLPPAAWNDRTIAAVAVWYFSRLPIDEAVARLEVAVQRNRRRFRPRSGKTATSGIDMDSLWPRILQLVVMVGAAPDPLPLANRLLRDPGTVLASRVA